MTVRKDIFLKQEFKNASIVKKMTDKMGTKIKNTKIKNICSPKDTINRLQRQVTKSNKVSAIYITDKGFAPRKNI